MINRFTTPLPALLRDCLHPDPATFGRPLSRPQAIELLRDWIRERSLSLPADTRKWGQAVWRYLLDGHWFGRDLLDYARAERKAIRRGMCPAWKRVGYLPNSMCRVLPEPDRYRSVPPLP